MTVSPPGTHSHYTPDMEGEPDESWNLRQPPYPHPESLIPPPPRLPLPIHQINRIGGRGDDGSDDQCGHEHGESAPSQLDTACLESGESEVQPFQLPAVGLGQVFCFGQHQHWAPPKNTHTRPGQKNGPSPGFRKTPQWRQSKLKSIRIEGPDLRFREKQQWMPPKSKNDKPGKQQGPYDARSGTGQRSKKPNPTPHSPSNTKQVGGYHDAGFQPSKRRRSNPTDLQPSTQPSPLNEIAQVQPNPIPASSSSSAPVSPTVQSGEQPIPVSDVIDEPRRLKEEREWELWRQDRF